MLSHEAYFKRLEGTWRFCPDFKILQWRLFLLSSLPSASKITLLFLVFAQRLLGPFELLTQVELAPQTVRHVTHFTKWGWTFFKSHKVFYLQENGVDLSIKGIDYFWPLMNKPRRTFNCEGTVATCATRANYQMPFVGIIAECTTYMVAPEAYIKIQLSGFEALFLFTKQSLDELKSRPLPSFS